ncbi:HotDog domain-containing protein [Pseudomassariella vexata]|uniref:HotDog domain-containing protein n=1 Tax=Pseudomassariella vexata TaxID=1141098 RepID=A0A1Y2EC94_9PEZI|nr:HotDog domain-containing protein [Pseudomassariella vexata]ORY69027.1 HotDog domain-containing protein [Pseudomassariella vexata]
MSKLAQLKNRTRSNYGFILEYRTRWSDNDMYGHMNNSIYNFMIDSVVNAYLIEFGGLSPPTSRQRGLVVHSHTDYFGSISYPAVAELGLRVNAVGKSSVRYEVGIFTRGVDEVKAVGEVVHVFVDSETGKPSAHGMDKSISDALRRILDTGISSKL